MHQKGNIGEDKINIAILDDYQNVALDFGGWANLPSNTSITVFNIGIEDESDLVT